MSAQPLYVRPMDLHAHTIGCDDARKDGSPYCNPVYCAADYDALKRSHDALVTALNDIREIIADKTYPSDAMRFADISAAVDRAALSSSKASS